MTNKLLEELMREEIHNLLHPKPREVCVCSDFTSGEYDPDYDYIKCDSCGGWMSRKRYMEMI